MDYSRMFALLDFLEEVRTNPITGNKLGHNRPVVFSFEEFTSSSSHMSVLFEEPGYLDVMLDILDSSTLGDKEKSPKVCGESHTKNIDNAVIKYEVDITTAKIRAYRDWIKKQNNKSQLELKENYLYLGEKKIKLQKDSRPYKIVKFLIKQPLHEKIKLTDIRKYLHRFPNEQEVTTKQIYNTLGELRSKIQNRLSGNINPWIGVQEKGIKLEL